VGEIADALRELLHSGFRPHYSGQYDSGRSADNLLDLKLLSNRAELVLWLETHNNRIEPEPFHNDV
jgi:hypothetical protein